MSYSGFKTTQKGRNLIAKLLAEKTLTLTKVMAGTGKIVSEEDIDGLNELLEPKMVGTSSEPSYLGDVMTLVLQFRSDMASSEDFWLNEYGVFALDPEEGEILLYYGNLGDVPQQLPGNTARYSGVLDFHVAITIGEDLDGVNLGYPASAFLTKEELENHDEDEEAHEALMFPRIQLWVSGERPTDEGIFLWVNEESEPEGFEFKGK